MPRSNLPPDPFAERTLAAYGADLRAGRVTAERVTRAFLDRIAALAPRLSPYVQVTAERAMQTARGIDQVLAGGTDLGPLMGVPVAIKDLFAVEGTEARAGSRLDVKRIIGPEGSFVKKLKRAGCIVLGKTSTTEFALGSFNTTHPVPWNPWSPKLHRMPGGSSHGSGVAQAAGLAALAIGTDTGGSVRIPASYCGAFGFKPYPELWEKDGVWPLNPVLDTIGTFTNSAADGALAFAALTGGDEPQPVAARTLRFGKPTNHFYERLDPEVEEAMHAALARLTQAGVEIVPVEVPHTDDFQDFFSLAGPASVIGFLGAERARNEFDRIDPITQARLKKGFDVPAATFVGLARRREVMIQDALQAMRGLDAWVTPTVPMIPAPYEEIAAGKGQAAWIARNTQNTRLVNVLGFAGISLPVHQGALPVGLQLIGPTHGEARLLSAARTVEEVIGRPRKPDVTGFLDRSRAGG